MKGIRMTNLRLSASCPSSPLARKLEPQESIEFNVSLRKNSFTPTISVYKEREGDTPQTQTEPAKATQHAVPESRTSRTSDPAASISLRSGSTLFSPPSTPGTTPTAVVSVLTADDPRVTFSPNAAHEIEPDIEQATLCHLPPPQQQQPPERNRRWRTINYCVIPLCVPLIAGYWVLSLVLATAATFLIFPSLFLAEELYWACPFIPYIWSSEPVVSTVGVWGSWLLQLTFEGAHCITVLARLATLPIRPHLPDFYILGFPKCGTTSMASYLRAHPGISGLSGMPGSEIFSKESHFFGGILGRHSTTNATLYRSFFPTILTRWWSEVVLGVDRWMCFDACPTYACQPHVAARVKAVTPDAKLIFMVRDPTAGVFSAETMLRNMGVPLDWTLAQPFTADGFQDSRFQFTEADQAFWDQLESLPPDAPLPDDLPERFYFKLHSYLMSGRFADRLVPWIKHFGAHNILLVDYQQFLDSPEDTVTGVLKFLGADTSRYKFRRQKAKMKGDYKGSQIHPAIAAWLSSTWFADSNAIIGDLLSAGCSSCLSSWP